MIPPQKFLHSAPRAFAVLGATLGVTDQSQLFPQENEKSSQLISFNYIIKQN